MNEQQSFFDRLNAWIRNSVMVKVVAIGILILLMLIPTSMVDSLIQERAFRQDEAVEEISSKWGGAQTITGPILTIPYYVYQRNEKNELVKIRQYAHFLPDDLSLEGNVEPTIRYRGIYEAVLYTADLQINGSFSPPDFSIWKTDSSMVVWDEATLELGIFDMRGIKDKMELKWGNEKYAFGPGTAANDVVQVGVSSRVPLDKSVDGGKINFNLDLNLNGSQSLKFIPVGAQTKVRITSPWATPSFTGQFLPDEREVTDQGFKAGWSVLQLNRNYPQQWTGAAYNPAESEFGVDLKVGVNQYQKNERTAKYAVLIISLTFVMFFFMEILNHQRIHPLQYLLVGFALSIFYVLLLAISEQWSFNLAYLVASLAVITLISVYVKGILKSNRLTALLSGSLVVVYGFVFVILQLEDYALLVGSVGLFLVLALVMYYTRSIDWYAAAQGDTTTENN